MEDKETYISIDEPKEHFKRMDYPFRDKFSTKDLIIYLGVMGEDCDPVVLVIFKHQMPRNGLDTFEALLWTKEGYVPNQFNLPANDKI